ncbi:MULTISPECIES: betaine/proline/choline family ABC transporter ATP-binding protein [Brevibacterium]|uniref:ABC-type quaternary amine transporter n=2 Tax=Brevibacterium TaxID=1696 RepID=A0A1H1PI73_BRESA|nr:betaine/proline/choline family ABC transporter ATP-binding protein [Brevibacterium sandarakinum]SDS10834.1 osmoprotectant transport system ATP-binding protein [Brevibacterium sandarakinum]
MTQTTNSPSPEAGSEPTVMIRLEGLTKRFPGQRANAVDELTLDIHEGEIVVLVGPSGCGKTTTMKMINRIIEPSAGRIILKGQDVTTTNADELRRRIGYVIQQVGLFPHMTIGENIATVPKLIGWDAKRVRSRVDELMSMVNMDPDQYRDRYPKQLSGGQQQRIGVARALSADPSVMLMDEPFGAIDPITRDRLQNEFLRLQSEVRKTIVFVTHDIDEAIKMGDRIAILQEGSRIAQYDTPEQILTAPANDFVKDFIGSGASLKRLNLSRVSEIELSTWPTVTASDSHDRAHELLAASEHSAVLVLDGEGRPVRWVGADDLRRDSEARLDQVGSVPQAVIEPRATLSDALNELVSARYAVTVVVDEHGRYQGVVDIDQINEAIRTMRSSAVAEARTEFASEGAAPGAAESGGSSGADPAEESS